MIETKLNGQTLDVVAENVKKLRELFPEIVVEDKIDFDRLQDVLGNYIERNDESYRFNWYGKSDAFRKSQTPSTGTLRPCVEESKNWDTTENLYIEGDNLEVLKILEKSYSGKIKMIYIDPPYNKDKDFIYPDKWSDPIKEYKRITGQVNDDGTMSDTEEETEGGRHSKWLSMMYARLRKARNLLAEDGLIFISIDDDEVANLKRLCNDVFGEENFLSLICVETSNGLFGLKAKFADSAIVKSKDYVLVYSSSQSKKTFQPLYTKSKKLFDTHFTYYKNDDFECNLNEFLESNTLLKMKSELLGVKPNINNLHLLMSTFPEINEFIMSEVNNIYRIREYTLKIDNEDLLKLQDGKKHKIGDVYVFLDENDNPCYLYPFAKMVNVSDDYDASYCSCVIQGDLWRGFNDDMGNIGKEGGVSYDNGKKPIRLIKNILKLINDKECLIMDFFSGSATTAHAVMQLNAEDGGNRKFIMVQIPENLDKLLNTAEATAKKDIKNSIDFLDSIEKPHLISEIGKYRINVSGDKIKAELQEKYDEYKQKQQSLLDDEVEPMNPEDLDIGFKVFKLDSSNLQRWDLDVGEDFYNLSAEEQNAFISEKLGLFANNFTEGRNELDMVYEIMLKYGLPLTTPIETNKVFSKTLNEDVTLYNIGMGGLIVCLSDRLSEDVADGIVKLVEETEPATVRVVVKDFNFITDAGKTNFKETLRTGVESYFAKTDNKANNENQFEFITI